MLDTAHGHAQGLSDSQPLTADTKIFIPVRGQELLQASFQSANSVPKGTQIKTTQNGAMKGTVSMVPEEIAVDASII